MNKIKYFILLMLISNTLFFYADEIYLVNETPLTINLTTVNVHEYDLHPQDNKHSLFNKLIGSPLKFFLLPIQSKLLFCFQLRF